MIFDLVIENLAFGGNGVGRLDGKAVFIPYTAPGDRVRCRLVRDKRRFAEGEVVEILDPSPHRREAPCPVFGQCGGCQWQYLPYHLQCSWKERILGDFLGRQAGVSSDILLPLVHSPREWNYRSRVQFKCRQTEQGFVMGFYRRASHFVIDVEQCPIMAAPLNEALARFRFWLADSPCPDKIPQVDLEVDDEKKIRAVVHFIGDDPDPLFQHLNGAVRNAGYALFIQSERKNSLVRGFGEENLHILPLGQGGPRLAYGPGGFAQVNLDQNRTMVRDLVLAAEATSAENILELFCGMGNLSIPLAASGARVVGIENFEPAVLNARKNALSNGINSAVFHYTPAAGAGLRFGSGENFDLAVLDPPRTGAYQEVKDLLKLRPRRILYVSCNPTTLTRDLLPLLHGGYHLRFCRPYDFFPQTHHIESLSVLERTG